MVNSLFCQQSQIDLKNIFNLPNIYMRIKTNISLSNSFFIEYVKYNKYTSYKNIFINVIMS